MQTKSRKDVRMIKVGDRVRIASGIYQGKEGIAVRLRNRIVSVLLDSGTECHFFPSDLILYKYSNDTKTPETVLKSCIDLYKAKNKEYQNTDDQFENFTKGAELNKCTREQTLWGYCTKQIVSLASIIKTGKNREKLSEKARDIIVYMAILEAMQ
jgi:hypothetical protein